ncbi:FAD-dependent oxidoreductase [Arsenicibacter rosenii]|uniref:Flavin-dependent monooxygenase n=1 Tax=Arsenicibacter rosenii TaxID=1750698 RepID=A0A1S2VF14_9BACT|nr:NAD(P)/FAD-dependent oxidoreductase [Arsenicibacter rosenii]OIN57302.1 2-polyprenyl-6-methoxyphenol hydroxylase [Arsenicibacter rosenii]
MKQKTRHIAIIGGGPGGLTLARLLQQKGLSVTVFERDATPDARPQGATLDLHQASGLAALREAGLLGEFYRHYRPGAGKMRVVDHEGHIFLDDHDGPDAAEDRPEIDRGPLQTLLLNSLRPGTVIRDSQFVGMEAKGQGWLIHFKNGTTAEADIVIGADGANSKIRPYLTDYKPVYSGITIVEGNLYEAAKNAPLLNALVNGGKVFALGHSQSLILSAKGDGSLSFYTGTMVPETWVSQSGIDFTDRLQVLAWFREAFSAWSPMWQELFQSHGLWFVPRPQYHFPAEQHWPSRPNLTLLGDAAHRMPPYAGEGVNMAMLDALELAQALTGDFPDPLSAIAAYEESMWARSAETTRMTLEQTQWLHQDNSLHHLINLFNHF